MSGVVTDVIDFEEFGRDPALAEAIADAQARSGLRATLVAQRKACGLTQKDVATAMETTQSAVSDFERGSTDPHLSTLQRYARAVGARVVVRASLPSSLTAESAWLSSVRSSGYRRRGVTMHPSAVGHSHAS
jgi:DNA-binding XRE family transcriptional regulator